MSSIFRIFRILQRLLISGVGPVALLSSRCLRLPQIGANVCCGGHPIEKTSMTSLFAAQVPKQFQGFE